MDSTATTDTVAPPAPSPPPGAAQGRARTRPDLAWQELMNGNARFVAGRPLHPGQDAAHREELRDERAHTLVFGCSDSRVSAEIIFDQGLGDLYVVRTLGHIIDAGVLGSAEFAVHMLRIPLIIVLGHDRCGAVAAAAQAVRTGTPPPGYIRDVTERITHSVLTIQRAQQPPDPTGEHPPIDDIEAEHIRGTARLLIDRSRILRDAVNNDTCLVLGAAYQLADGHVRLVTHGA